MWPLLLYCPLLVDEEAGPSCVLVLSHFPARILGHSGVLSWSGNLGTSLESIHYLDNATKPWLQTAGGCGKGRIGGADAGSWSVLVRFSFRWRLVYVIVDELYGGLFSILLLLLLPIVLYGFNLGPGGLVAAAEQPIIHLVALLGYLVKTLLLFIQLSDLLRLYLTRELVDTEMQRLFLPRAF